MKLVSTLALFALWAPSVAPQNPNNPPPEQVFCGSQACLIDTPISCETLVEEYTFQGSCCSLQPIPGIRGCRVEVKANGNCFWLPDCELCDAAHPSECNKIYRTTSTEACPRSDFDPVGNNATKGSCAPTSAPTRGEAEMTQAPSSAPSLGLFASTLGVISATFWNF